VTRIIGQERVRCAFCEAEPVAFGLVRPPMCARHYEVARMACILERKPQGVTVPGIRRMLERVIDASPVGSVDVTMEAVPGLLWDLLESRQRMWTTDERMGRDSGGAA